MTKRCLPLLSAEKNSLPKSTKDEGRHHEHNKKRKKFGEVAGGTTTKCAAVCCCCPFMVMNLLVLAVYKVQARLCKKAWRRQKSILKGVLVSGSIDLPAKLYDAVLYSYRMVDIALGFYKEMQRCRISQNVYTLNMVIGAFCKSGKLENAVEEFKEIERIGFSPTIASYNTLIVGQTGNSEMGGRLYEEMVRNGIKTDILTFNALILGLCKVALITEQCVRKNSENAFQLYKSMIKSGCHPNKHTFQMLISTFCENEDFDGAIQIMQEMLERYMSTYTGIVSELYSGLCQCRKDQFAMKLLNRNGN
ncbi:hypothetical protein Dsin_004324 [Dipteronia sinensis]|uniref:Pentatricopeptide repeat-containing protein n=1 Tax=Dipteronia sinensis TaxID=43782 RepID=A0AAE0BAM5_9ROSI|nr:hypothetical protein Dsin_004324 [Dipteronia sinensis]